MNIKPKFTIWSFLQNLLKSISSLHFAIFGLVGLFIIVLWGTFSQLELGIFYTQKKYFQSIFITHTFANGVTIPVFFGGLVFGSILTVGLVGSLFYHIKWKLKNLGLILIHLGLIALLVGSFLTGKLAKESQLILHEGESSTYSTNRYEPELVIYRYIDDTTIKEWRFNHNHLQDGSELLIPNVMKIKIDARYQNSYIRRSPESNIMMNGFGRHYDVVPMPLNQQTEGNNTISAILTITPESESSPEMDSKRWIMTQAIDADQEIRINNVSYFIRLRDLRIDTPYSVTLIDFSHDVYPGTTVPKNFSSLVRIQNPLTNEDQTSLIYMNHPLRYDGKTYYQASFAENDTVSVLQVVENPVWLFPYVSSIIISIGLFIQFGIGLIRFRRKSA
jgi:hypothetical protein